MTIRQNAAKGKSNLGPAKNIDEYLNGLDEEKRGVLIKLRQTIRTIQPDAEECISYGIPAFRRKGTVIAGFASTIKGYSFFPFSGSTLGSLEAELRDFEKTKSSLHFTAEKPLKTQLLRKLINTRIAETEFRKKPQAAKNHDGSL